MSTKKIIPVIDELISCVTKGAEIGCFKGELSRELLKSFPNLTLHCVDPWKSFDGYTEGGYICESSQEDFDKWYEEFKSNTDPYKDRRIIHRNTGANVDTFNITGLKFVFIDGDHSYKSVSRDILNWSKRLVDGGILCGHDYDAGWPGVIKAVDQFVGDVNVIKGTSVWWTVWD